MRQQPASRRIDSNTSLTFIENDANAPTAVEATSAPHSQPAPIQRRAQPRSHHLQDAWRVRQFAGRGYFGSVTMPRLMRHAEVIAVQHALDRLGPFSKDRIDNCGRLHTALIGGNAASAEAVLTLVRHRVVDPDQRGPDGDTLLHSLVEHGRQHPLDGMRNSAEQSTKLADRIELLVAAGAKPTATDHQGRTAFERILSSTRPDWEEVANALLAATPANLHLNKVNGGPTLLHRAARHGDIDLVKRWITLGLPTDVGSKGFFAQLGADIDTPLRAALKNPTLEGLEIAHTLINAGANPTARSAETGDTILHWAARGADKKLLTGWAAAGLSSNQPTVDRSGMTPLMNAIIHHPKKEEQLRLLCDHAGINKTDRNGRAAIHYAASSLSRCFAVGTLSTAGADLNLHARDGKSPLELSIGVAIKHHDDFLFLGLVHQGADPDIPNPVTGVTPRRLYNNYRHWWDGAPLP